MSQKQERVLILGGGLAGLAAAVRLAGTDLQVGLLESRDRLGGRAGSFQDPQSGQLVDACQHVSMGCCSQYQHFCETIGIDHLLEPQRTLYFMTPDGRVSVFAADRLPAPLHLGRSLARLHYLTWMDKVRIGWGLLQMLRVSAETDEPLLPWLKRHRQNQRTLDRFWEVVVISALNDRLKNVGLKYARKVFVEAFLQSRTGYEVQLPKVPLGKLYGDELHLWFQKQHVTLQTNAAVRQIHVEHGRVSHLTMRDGSIQQADWYVSALPFDRLLHVLPEEVIQQEPMFAQLKQLDVSPITSVHLWFDRPIMNLPHVVLVDCLGQWIFNRGEVQAGEYYLQVVISASEDLKLLGRDEIQNRIYQEIQKLYPNAQKAQLLRAKVITEHTATFRLVPGIDQLRPPQETNIANLFLAGDWTATHWPATMESAIRSGYRAGELLQQVRRNPTSPKNVLR